MPSSAGPLCSGASGLTSRSTWSTAGSMMTTSGSRPPPCTTRCAMTSGRAGSAAIPCSTAARYPPVISTVAPASVASSAAPSSNSLYLSVALPQLMTSTRIAPPSAPGPVPDLGQILAMLRDVHLVPPERIVEPVPGAAPHPLESWHSLDHVQRQPESVHPVEDHHVER